MKKLIPLFCFFIVYSAIAQVQPTDTDGNGYINIKSLNHLHWLSLNYDSWDDNYELDNDINASIVKTWITITILDTLYDTLTFEDPGPPPETIVIIDTIPILDTLLGMKPLGRDTVPFTGEFDGKGHTISGLYFEDKNYNSPIGFFGTFDSAASVHDLNLEDCKYVGNTYVGILAGMNYLATIYNCSTSGEIYGKSNAGGLIGSNFKGTITRCHSDVVADGRFNVGGLLGINNEGNVDQCYSSGSIDSEQYTGGFVAANNGSIENCYTYAYVDGDDHIGGFIAANAGIVKNSYCFGLVYSEFNTGGFVEQNVETISNCLWDVEASGYYTSDGGYGYTTERMMDIHSYTDLAWDFIDIWNIASHINKGYPHLQCFVYKLETPTLLNPEEHANGVDLLPMFEWDDVSEATQYHIQIAFQAEFDSTTQILIDDFTDISEFIPSERFNENQELFWRVKALNENDSSMWSSVWKFTTEDIIDPPKLIAPIDSAKRVVLKPEFLWSDPFNTANYNIQITTDITFDSLSIDTNITETTFTPEFSLSESTKYYWRMTATDADDTSFWSEVWEFTTKGPIDPPQLIAPIDSIVNLTLLPTFEWTSIEISESYNFELATDPDFTNIAITMNLLDTIYTVEENLLEDTLYYWRVNAMNTEHTSVWSETWMFQTGFDKVFLVSPEDSIVNFSLDSSLIWRVHTNASAYRYKIQIAIDEHFTSASIIETAETTIDTTYLPTQAEVNTNYYWRVQALVYKDKVGMWSDTWKYKTGIGTATLLYPEDLSVDINFINQTFRWDDVEGAEYYHIQASYNEDFTNLALSIDSLKSNTYKAEYLIPETKYYWRVKAWNSDSRFAVQWSEEWEFTTKVPEFYLNSPQDADADVAIPVPLKWNTNPPSIPMFILQVSETENFDEVIFQKNDIAINQYILRASDASEIAVNKTFYWRVAAKIDHYTSSFSDAWSFTVSTVSVTDIAEEISLYPQPANENISIVISGLTSTISKYSIVDIEGKTLLSEDIFLNNGDHNISINTSAVASGKYFLLLYSEKGILIKDLMISK